MFVKVLLVTRADFFRRIEHVHEDQILNIVLQILRQVKYSKSEWAEQRKIIGL